MHLRQVRETLHRLRRHRLQQLFALRLALRGQRQADELRRRELRELRADDLRGRCGRAGPKARAPPAKWMGNGVEMEGEASKMDGKTNEKSSKVNGNPLRNY